MIRKRTSVLLLVAAPALFAVAAAQENKPANPPPPAEPQVSAQPKRAEPPPQHQVGAQRQLIEASEAAAGEDETAQFKHSSSVRFVARATGLSLASAYWLCVAFNFAVIAALIMLGMKKALPSMFRDRTAMIQRAMEEARKASQEATSRLRDIESRLAQLDQEIAGLRATAEEEARRDEERIRAAAEDDRQKIVHAAQQEVAAAGRSARQQLKTYAAELAITLAEQKIRVNATEDRELVRTFADQLGKDGN